MNAQVIECLEHSRRTHQNLARRRRTVEEINAFREKVYKRRGMGSDSAELIRRMRDERGAHQR